MMQKQARVVIKEPIGILGYGVEGASTARFLLAQGYRDITVFDLKAPVELNPQVRYAGNPGTGHYLLGINAMQTVFRSAGVRPDLPEILDFIAQGGILTSQTELAFTLVGRSNIIGITGTMGKGTCCSLLQAMLTEADIPCKLGGNIGVPALDLAVDMAPGEKLILELSSFQLSTLQESPAYAAVLRTTTEHLDWHPSRDEYWLHKSNLVSQQKAGDVLAYCGEAEGSVWIASLSHARKVAFGANSEVQIDEGELRWTKRGFKIPIAATRLKGSFNLENIAAAGILALELGAEPRDVVAAAMAFKGLEHRLEFVRERQGVSFYNDSYATRPEATIGAINAMWGTSLGLILGGSEKHADFVELASSIAGATHIRGIALIGHTANRLQKELEKVDVPASGALTQVKKCLGLEEAVDFLLSQVKKGTIVLSPACASFGMFENYKERGKAFKRLVENL